MHILIVEKVYLNTSTPFVVWLPNFVNTSFISVKTLFYSRVCFKRLLSNKRYMNLQKFIDNSSVILRFCIRIAFEYIVWLFTYYCFSLLINWIPLCYARTKTFVVTMVLSVYLLERSFSQNKIPGIKVYNLENLTKNFMWIQNNFWERYHVGDITVSTFLVS